MSAQAPAGRLTTHVLDTADGRPAAGVRLALYRLTGPEGEPGRESGRESGREAGGEAGGEAGRERLVETVTNADGRCAAPLLAGAAFKPGRYEIVFRVGAYFRARGAPGAGPPFLDEVPVRFAVADPGAHYHVPLLVSPYGYTTYRGS